MRSVEQQMLKELQEVNKNLRLLIQGMTVLVEGFTPPEQEEEQHVHSYALGNDRCVTCNELRPLNTWENDTRLNPEAESPEAG
jgi:hypothetical protein